jgi:hypothetical protein
MPSSDLLCPALILTVVCVLLEVKIRVMTYTPARISELMLNSELTHGDQVVH